MDSENLIKFEKSTTKSTTKIDKENRRRKIDKENRRRKSRKKSKWKILLKSFAKGMTTCQRTKNLKDGNQIPCSLGPTGGCSKRSNPVANWAVININYAGNWYLNTLTPGWWGQIVLLAKQLQWIAVVAQLKDFIFIFQIDFLDVKEGRDDRQKWHSRAKCHRNLFDSTPFFAFRFFNEFYHESKIFSSFLYLWKYTL